MAKTTDSLLIDIGLNADGIIEFSRLWQLILAFSI